MTGGGDIDEIVRGGSTPRAELERISAGRAKLAVGARERIMEATVEVCGERGFRAATVQDAIDRCGANRGQFYRLFSGKAEAYVEGHAAALDALAERLLGAARAHPGWRPGLRAALAELGAFLVDRPLLARGVLIEVHVAGGAALARRAEAHARLAAAIDAARRELPEGDEGPPQLTSTFMLGAVEAAAVRALELDQPAAFAEQVPELAQMIVAAYFGDAAA